MITVENLRKSFGRGTNATEVLRDIDLTIPDGKWTAIVGPSGSGKSTLLNCLSGLLKPDFGHVNYDGKDLYRLKEKERSHFRRKHIGFVFQDFKLLPYYSVIDNVILPLLYDEAKQKLYEKARQILLHIGIHEQLFTRLPRSLSGGEKQRVAIARALIADPDVLVCDEPTGNLDQDNRDIITELIDRLRNEGKTIVLVTHDMEVAKKADDIYQLTSGSLVPYEVTA